MTTRCYDPDRINLILVGIPVADGFGEDTMVEITRASAGFGYKVGVDGSVTRYKLKNKVQEIKLVLAYGAPVNDELSALYNLDQDQPNGAGIAPTTVADLNGTSLLFAGSSWIAKMPDMKHGKESGEVEWLIHCVVDTENVGSL